MQQFTHYFLHLIAPGIIAYLWHPGRWKKTWLILVATMVVDVDHLLARPVFDPDRCSIGFHILHSYYAIAIYGILFLRVRNRMIKVILAGLLLHMATDYLDCLWMTS